MGNDEKLLFEYIYRMWAFTASELHTGQQDFVKEINAAYADGKRKFMVMCGNGWGKSYMEMQILVNLCYPPEFRTFHLDWFDKFDKMPKSEWAIRIYATRSNFAEGGAIHTALEILDKSAKISLYNKRITINGVNIQCFTHDQKIGQTEGGNLQLILSDEPFYTKKMFTAANTRLRVEPLIMMLFGTPVESRHGYLMDYDKTKGFFWYKGSLYANPHLPKDYIETIEQICKINPDEEAPRLFGEFATLTGRVFKTFNREEHVINALPDSADNYNWYVSIDPHNKKQCFAVLLAVDNQEQVYVVDNYPSVAWNTIPSSSLTIKQQCEAITAMVRRWTNKTFTCYGDKIFFNTTFNTRDGHTNLHNEYRKSGLSINTDAVSMAWDVRRGAISEYLYYEDESFPAIHFLPDANNVITALERFSYKNKSAVIGANFNTIVEEEWECPISALSFALTVNLKPYNPEPADLSNYAQHGNLAGNNRNGKKYSGKLA